MLSTYETSTPLTEVGIEIKVIDDGIGISESDQSKLFQPFFHSTDELVHKKLTGSHGIGLYNCKMLAELLNGSISV